MATSSLRALSQFYGSILAGTAGGLTTLALWSAVQNAAVDQVGSPLSGVSIMDMNVLRGLAGSQLAAAAQFQAAGTNEAITSNMVANELDQRSQMTRTIAGNEYIARFEHTFLDANGDQQTEWRTSVLSALPITKFDLLDTLEEDAEGYSDDYGTTSIGVGNVMLTIR